jgi:hypothetical protein
MFAKRLLSVAVLAAGALVVSTALADARPRGGGGWSGGGGWGGRGWAGPRMGYRGYAGRPYRWGGYRGWYGRPYRRWYGYRPWYPSWGWGWGAGLAFGAYPYYGSAYAEPWVGEVCYGPAGPYRCNPVPEELAPVERYPVARGYAYPVEDEASAIARYRFENRK